MVFEKVMVIVRFLYINYIALYCLEEQVQGFEIAYCLG